MIQIKNTTLIITALLALNVSSNANSEPEKSAPVTTPAAAEVNPTYWGVDTKNIAKDIQAGDDFYRYVNKGWLDSAKIPQGLTSIGSFEELFLSTEKQVDTIIKAAIAKNAQAGTPEQQVADLYASYTDIKGRNQRGFDMLKDELNAILASKDRGEIASKMGRVGHPALFGVSVSTDSGNPQRYILMLNQSGLGLPGREYYLNKGEPFIGHRAAYLTYIEGVLQRAGLDKAKQRAKAIFDFETKIAQQHWTPTQQRDPVKTYNVMGKDKLLKYAAGFDWTAFLKESGYDGVNNLVVSENTAIKGMAALFGKTPVGTLRDYVAFQYLNAHAPLLSEPWVDANFDLFSRRLLGIAQPRPLEQRAVAFVSGTLGEEVAKLYVERYFPAEYKAKTEEMVGFIRASMQEHLQKLDWMDEATRKEALTKLDNFGVQIGYPEKWRDFSPVKISKDDLVANIHRLITWLRQDERAKLDEPIRKWEWGHQPHEINAYYSPDRNEIVFLAAILQPPFFDPKADPAVNFGAIGVVVGHEIGHGFDDQGRQSDGTGKLRNWWTKASTKNFNAKTKRLVAQYNRYSPIKGLHVNGQLTLGENIGDMCGVAVAYSAYQKYAAAKYPDGKPPILDGFTGNQRFFMGYAQLWRNLMTDDATRMIVLTNAHSPGEFRTNGILTNFDPWYDAFGVTEKNKLYLPKKDRISIW
ncbi:MAG: M13 family metallopeptidase [Methylococcales bacterium]|nr:M13 family metallopeptidase [Methylococcales bacterium]